MKNPAPPLLRCYQGVTLIELMVAITVLAVLAGIGIPAFSNLMRSSQIAAEANNLVAALTLARSEAMKRGVRVSVCPSNGDPDDGCTDDWGDGYLVFSDDFGDAGKLEDPDNDVPIQFFSAPANGVTVVTEADSVVFMPSAALFDSARSFSISKAGCHGSQRRVVDVAPTGRIGLTRVDCAMEEEEESGS